MPVAARLGDPVQHSNAMTGLLAGMAVGAAIGVFVVATGGAGLLVGAAIIGGAAAAGAGVGEVLGSLSLSGGTITGPIATGSGNVAINGIPAARAFLAVGDSVACKGTPPIYIPSHKGKLIAQGSATVLINSSPAARVGDKTQCDAPIQSGSGNVLIGGGQVTTLDIESEVPGWIHTGLLVVGLASAVVLAGPVVAVAGLAGGFAGGYGGSWLGGIIFGEGSDGQKIMGLVGSFIGGGLAAKGSMGPAQALGARMGGPWGAFVGRGVPGMQAQIAATNYIEHINELNYELPPGEDPAFWTGKGAMDAAVNDGYATMESTAGGKTTLDFVDSISDVSGWDTQKPIWEASSETYANSIGQRYGTVNPETGLPISGPNSGQTVRVYVSDQANPQSIYFTVEKPTLLSWGVTIEEVIVPTAP